MIKWMISSSVLIFAVIIVRHLLKGKISLRIQYALWLLVAVRLVFPVNFGTSFLSIEHLTEKVKEQPSVQTALEVSGQTITITSYEEAYKEVIQKIEETKLAMETHEMEHANNIYKVLHDMDYFLLRYGIEDVGVYTLDDSIVSKYYGVLNVYSK